MLLDNLANFMHGLPGLAVGLLLLALLAAREVARDTSGPRWRALAVGLTIGLTPIVIIFLATVAVLFVQAFR